jgi:hypothetical protein
LLFSNFSLYCYAAATGSGALSCALVVDPADGSLVGIATAASLANALEEMTRRRRSSGGGGGGGGGGGSGGNTIISAAEACDPNVPWVNSSATLLDALQVMGGAGPGGAGLAVVVAGGGERAGGGGGSGVDGSGGGGGGGGSGVTALGVLEARAVEAERDAGTLQAALRSFKLSSDADQDASSDGGGDGPSEAIRLEDSSSTINGR